MSNDWSGGGPLWTTEVPDILWIAHYQRVRPMLARLDAIREEAKTHLPSEDECEFSEPQFMLHDAFQKRERLALAHIRSDRNRVMTQVALLATPDAEFSLDDDNRLVMVL
jgi:hypothetical protein